MNRPVYIYTLENPLTKEVRYVGKALVLERRFKGHLECSKRTPTSSWVKSLLEKGISPVMDTIETTDEEGWQEAERFWITSLRFLGCRLTNLENGGNGAKQVSEETKRKIATSATGRKQSAETLAKLSEIRKGRVLSKEHKLKISQGVLAKGWPEGFWERRAKTNSERFKGVKLSSEHREKLSKAWEKRRTRPVPMSTRYKYSVCSKRRWRNFRDERVLDYIQL